LPRRFAASQNCAASEVGKSVCIRQLKEFGKRAKNRKLANGENPLHHKKYVIGVQSENFVK
jgi:hypothetical protein